MTGEDDRHLSSHEEMFKRVERYEQSLPIVRVTDGAHSVRMALPSRLCHLRATTFFSKEPETIRWIAAMPEGSIVFDVGANIGIYTLWAAITRSAVVYAFEPEAGNYAILNTNLQLNGLSEQCRAYCTGVADRVGFDALRCRDRMVGQSGHQVGGKQVGGITQGIVTTTLDHLVYEAGLPCPSYLKIDVDGLEPAIVNGAARLLADERLKSILIELAVKDQVHRAVIDRLTGLGFIKDEELERAVYAKTAGVKYTGNIIFTRP